MLKLLAIIFGLLMLAAGILGFLPDFTTGGKLFGMFSVSLWHNVAHIATGVIALLCGLSSSSASKIFFILFGIVYGALAAYGFSQGETSLLGLVSFNKADDWLHAGIAIVWLYVGLFFKSR